jgi:TPP-dependent pyruvate/acetoin dehydrogenase alpha subunit
MGEPDTSTLLLNLSPQDHLTTALEHNATLMKQVRMLEEKLRQLEKSRGVKVLLYGNHKGGIKVALACTANERERWDPAVASFRKRSADFSRAGIAWTTVHDIELNEVHELPFSV